MALFSVKESHPPEEKLARTRSHKAKALRQALQMQDVLHEIVLSDTAKPLERSSCARAWTDLEERKRILRGRPLPGQLQPDKDKKPGRRRSGRVIAAISPEQVAREMGAA